MHRSHRSPHTLLAPSRWSVLAAVVAAGCTALTPSNPYDPGSPADTQKPGSVHGTLTLVDADVDGCPEGERAALATMTVSLRDSSGDDVQRDGAALSVPLLDVQEGDDAAGFFVGDLVPGSYTLVVNGLPEGYGDAPEIPFTVIAGDDVDLRDTRLRYSPRGSYTIDGTIDTTSLASSTQTVTLYRNTCHGVLAHDSTLAVGAFRFEGLLGGSYALVAESDGAMPAFRLDIPVSNAQASTSFSEDNAIALQPITAALLPVTTGDGAVIVDEGHAYVQDAPVPLAVLAFADGAQQLGITQMRLSTSADFLDATGAAVDFVPYAASTSVELPGEDGDYTIHAQFRASSSTGFQFDSPVFTLPVTRDTAAPLVFDPALVGLDVVDDRALSASRTVALRADVFDATSAVAAVGVGIDAIPSALAEVVVREGTARVDQTVTFDSDGVHELVIVARDRARNETPQAVRLPVLVDTVDPEVSLEVINAPGGVLADGAALLRVVSNVATDTALRAGFGVDGASIAVDEDFTIDADGPSASASVLVPDGAAAGGAVTFVAVVVDPVGNTSRLTRTVTLADAPSAPQLSINGGASLTNARTVSLAFSAVHADSVELTCGSPTTTTLRGTAFAAGVFACDLPDVDGTYQPTATFRNARGDAVTLGAFITLDRAAPTLATAIAIDDGAPFATSVSTTLSVIASGADEMAIVHGAFDGNVAALTFTPYTATSALLLPAGDGPKPVCVVLRDDAGNVLDPGRTPTACTTIELDTTAPSSPVILTDDGQVLRTPPTKIFRVAFAASDADVTTVIATVEGPFDGIPAPAATVQAVSGGAFVLDVRVLGALPGRDDTPHLIRVTAFDRAGNPSDESTLTVFFDDKNPGVPEIADADPAPNHPGVFYPRKARGTPQRKAPRVNADSFAVRIRTNPFAVDRNFDHYEVASTAGLTSIGPVFPLDADFIESAGTDGLLFPLTQGAPLNGSGNVAACSPRACLNNLFVRAVDAAGNKGPSILVEVVEDSGAPTQPLLSPREGVMVGDAADIVLQVESADDPDPCIDDGDCLDGGICRNNTCDASTKTGNVAVRAYEIKQGTDRAFGGVPDRQPTTGPWRLRLTQQATNEICVRGIDEAGNAGIEDCVRVDEASRVQRPATSATENRAKVAGSYVLYRAGSDFAIDDLGDGAPQNGAGLPNRLESLVAPNDQGGAAQTFDISAGLVRTSPAALVGSDLVNLAFEGVVQNEPIVQVRSGPVRTLVPGSSDSVTNVNTQRNLRGFAPSLNGDTLSFACGDDGNSPGPGNPLTIVRMPVATLFGGSLPAGVTTGTIIGNVSLPGIADRCADFLATASTPINVVRRPAGKQLCTGTNPRSLGDTTVWCETANKGSASETGDIMVAIGAASPIVARIGDAAAEAHGRLVTGGTAALVQPLLTPTHAVWVDRSSRNVFVRRLAVVAQSLVGANETLLAGGSTVSGGALYDADGQRIVMSQVRADAQSDDLQLLELVAGRTVGDPTFATLQALTDDLVPNTDGSISGSVIVSTSLTSASEDVQQFILGTDGWLESGDRLRFRPQTSTTTTVWIELIDDALALVAEDIASGTQTLVLQGQQLLDEDTFAGGTTLGPSTHQVGGKRVVVLKRNSDDCVTNRATLAYTARIYDISVQPTPPPIVINDIAPVLPERCDETSALFTIDVDGDAIAYITRDNKMHVEALGPSGRVPPVPFDSLRNTSAAIGDGNSGDAGIVPTLSLDERNGTAVVVWQQGNTIARGDFRRDRTGTLRIATVNAAGQVVTSAIDARDVIDGSGAIALAGRAPSVAILDNGDALLAYSDVAINGSDLTRVTRACPLEGVSGVIHCRTKIALDTDFGVNTTGSIGNPIASRAAFIVWPNGKLPGRAGPQLEVYDFARDQRSQLTAGLDDGLIRTDVAAAGPVIVWLDARLGTNDVWLHVVP